MTPDEARARFDTARVARLATADAQGRPHVVPVTFALDDQAIVTAIDAKPKRPGLLRRLQNIAANSHVSLLVDEYDEDWSRLWWARADGRARVVPSGPERDHVLERLRERYPQYGSVAIEGPAIVIGVDRWSGWSAG